MRKSSSFMNFFVRMLFPIAEQFPEMFILAGRSESDVYEFSVDIDSLKKHFSTEVISLQMSEIPRVRFDSKNCLRDLRFKKIRFQSEPWKIKNNFLHFHPELWLTAVASSPVKTVLKFSETSKYFYNLIFFHQGTLNRLLNAKIFPNMSKLRLDMPKLQVRYPKEIEWPKSPVSIFSDLFRKERKISDLLRGGLRRNNRVNRPREKEIELPGPTGYVLKGLFKPYPPAPITSDSPSQNQQKCLTFLST